MPSSKIQVGKRLAIGLVAAVLLAFGGCYRFVVSGGMTARQTPSAAEGFVARALVNLGIPKDAHARKNPLSARVDGADAAAGRELYRLHCVSCHGADGRGQTAAGRGLYPPPFALTRSGFDSRNRTDGDLFYLVRNGIRNTGMPGWELADAQIWQLVSYMRALPPTSAPESVGAYRGVYMALWGVNAPSPRSRATAPHAREPPRGSRARAQRLCLSDLREANLDVAARERRGTLRRNPW